MRLAAFVIIIGTSLFLMKKSHSSLFEGSSTGNLDSHDHHHPEKVITTGIMSRVRHPLYLGTLLMYLAFVLASLSVISIISWIVIFTVYDRMASFEEKQMEKMFGREYLEYKERVSKWIPL